MNQASDDIRSNADKLTIKKLWECRTAGDWEGFVELALCNPRFLPFTFSYYDKVPDKLKYSFAIEAYTHRGDSMPSVRKAVRTARRYGSPELPANLANQDFITVYRAGEEPIDKAKYRISWSTELEVAEFFHRRNIEFIRRPSHIYQAKIKPESCIAYTNERQEHEIMQYRKVFDVEEITRRLTGVEK